MPLPEEIRKRLAALYGAKFDTQPQSLGTDESAIKTTLNGGPLGPELSNEFNWVDNAQADVLMSGGTPSREQHKPPIRLPVINIPSHPITRAPQLSIEDTYLQWEKANKGKQIGDPGWTPPPMMPAEARLKQQQGMGETMFHRTFRDILLAEMKGAK